MAALYDLIRRQFLSCQMSPARYENSRIKVQASDEEAGRVFELRASGRVVLFDGFTRMRHADGEGARQGQGEGSA